MSQVTTHNMSPSKNCIKTAGLNGIQKCNEKNSLDETEEFNESSINVQRPIENLEEQVAIHPKDRKHELVGGDFSRAHGF